MMRHLQKDIVFLFCSFENFTAHRSEIKIGDFFTDLVAQTHSSSSYSSIHPLPFQNAYKMMGYYFRYFS